MWRLSLLSLVLLLTLGPLGAQEAITASVSEERKAAPDEPNRQGLQFVKRHLSLGPVGLRYQQLVDPAAGDKPVNQRYADYLLGCEFPAATWNWDLEYFLEVTVARPGEKPFAANRALLQRGIYVLQQGARAVADMVWPLPPLAGRPPAEMVVRLAKPAAEPRWLYLRATVEGDPEARIVGLRFSSYPTVTSGPPERQRWVASLTRELPMTNAAAALDPAAEWGLVLHNRMAQEDGGALLVVDPGEVQAASAAGTYAVGVSLQTAPAPAVHAAMGIFWDTPYQQATADFRAEAPVRLERLRAVDWSVPTDPGLWVKTAREVEELLALTPAVGAQLRGEWATLRGHGDAAMQAAVEGKDPGAARRFLLLVRQAEDLKARLYEPALQALVEQATR